MPLGMGDGEWGVEGGANSCNSKSAWSSLLIFIPCYSPEWNSLMSFLVEVSRRKLRSSETQVFVWLSTPYISVLQNAIHEYTRIFLFHRFFVRNLKS